MKTVQKLEFYSGVSVLLAAFLQFLLFIFYMPRDKDSSLSVILISGFIFLLLPSIAIFIGSYLHAVSKERIGFGILMFFGVIFMSLYIAVVSVGFLAGVEINKNAIIGTLIWLFPSIFVGCNITFAIINAWSTQKQERFL